MRERTFQTVLQFQSGKPPVAATWPSYSAPTGLVPNTSAVCSLRKVSSTKLALSDAKPSLETTILSTSSS